jgi:hypothetical protein
MTKFISFASCALLALSVATANAAPYNAGNAASGEQPTQSTTTGGNPSNQQNPNDPQVNQDPANAKGKQQQQSSGTRTTGAQPSSGASH